MGFSLITSYPSWFLLVCLLAGGAFASLLYFRERNSDFGKGKVRLLAVLRGLSVTLIAFLLLSPLVKKTSRLSERPIVLLALDNSSSITQGRDSAYYKNEFAVNFRKLAEKLSGKFDVRTFTFGEKVTDGLTPSFTENQTNMEALFREVRDRFSNRNLAAMVLAGDGIYNQGTDPLYASDNAPYSIYTVALGDTSQHKDILISRVNYNRIAFLGNDFPVEITITAHKATGTSGKLIIASGN
ncbi:MAG TPA: hypothetical protein PKN21_11060, partial [Bacteroidales bacterium]|nr:hypothetical protein [Bacteroidales bacterium]